MTAKALALIFVSAWAHAGWNYLSKASGDKRAFFWGFTSIGALLYLPLAVIFWIREPVHGQGWILVMGTVVLHVVYFRLLQAAYTVGDLSLVYPVSRGTGLVLVAIAGSVLLRERVSLLAAGAITTIILGIVIVNLRPRKAEEPGRRGSGFRGSALAIATGLVIACYSVWDKYAIDTGTVNPVTLGYASFVAQAVVASIFVRGRGEAVRTEFRTRWRMIVLAAVLAPGSYLLVLYALTFSQVSYIAPSREVGIVIGVLLARFLLKESYSTNRFVGSFLIVAGVITLALVP